MSSEGSPSSRQVSTTTSTSITESSSSPVEVKRLITTCQHESRNLLQNIRNFIQRGHLRKRSCPVDGDVSSSESNRSPVKKKMRVAPGVCLAGGGDYTGRGGPMTADDPTNRQARIQSWIEKEKQNHGRYEHNPRPVYNPNCIFCNPEP